MEAVTEQPKASIPKVQCLIGNRQFVREKKQWLPATPFRSDGEAFALWAKPLRPLTSVWEQLDKTEAAFKGGWFHSGDLGSMDDEGYIFIVDRVRNLINTGGVLVAGREVEEAVFTHPAVSEVAVIALPDPKWIEAVTAVVVLRPQASATEKELIAHVRARRTAHKMPKRVIFTDRLPRNAPESRSSANCAVSMLTRRSAKMLR